VNPAWIRSTREGVILSLHVQPGAKRTEVVGEYGDALKIRLAAPPVDGKANARLIEFLADRLGIAGYRVELVAGLSSRAKRVAVSGVSADEIRGLLLPE
jgi:hypothetical protein